MTCPFKIHVLTTFFDNYHPTCLKYTKLMLSSKRSPSESMHEIIAFNLMKSQQQWESLYIGRVPLNKIKLQGGK